MKQPLVHHSIKISEEEKHYLSVLKTRYRLKINQFIRDAIIEKMERDINEIREKYKTDKEDLPF